ncbi:sugar phosphate isomerase/epimerase family protein [Phycisphaerales bacterium AB-hyl4]|uniref:Sugar phosphate isomerase/epimerase family protein n=1 Tax=Natronomicrosphaera hydrolytica TaxID=3242702 RepID=A0ABV4U4Y6_9BACT
MTWTFSAFADEAGGSIDEQIAALQRVNMKFIDPRSVDGHNITALPEDVAKQAQQKLEAAGITVQMYGSPIGKIDAVDDIEEDLQKLRHLAKMRDIFGCNAVRIFSYYNKTGLSHADWQQKATDNLKRLIELAEQLDLVLYHENESKIFGDKTDDVLAIAELRGPRLKLIYDFANYIRTGEAGWDSWQKCKAITDCFHFKDQRKNGEHMPMGQGETDAREILVDAAKAGWSGPCTLEPHLTHSKAVVATHSTGTGAHALADMSKSETFHLAATEAQKLMDELNITYS